VATKTVLGVRHTAYYSFLMQRPMRLNLSTRGNKGRVVINRTSANYHPFVVRLQPLRGVDAVLDHPRGGGTARRDSASDRSPHLAAARCYNSLIHIRTQTTICRRCSSRPDGQIYRPGSRDGVRARDRSERVVNGDAVTLCCAN